MVRKSTSRKISRNCFAPTVFFECAAAVMCHAMKPFLIEERRFPANFRSLGAVPLLAGVGDSIQLCSAVVVFSRSLLP